MSAAKASSTTFSTTRAPTNSRKHRPDGKALETPAQALTHRLRAVAIVLLAMAGGQCGSPIPDGSGVLAKPCTPGVGCLPQDVCIGASACRSGVCSRGCGSADSCPPGYDCV